MDAKITLSFEDNVIAAAKQYASSRNISLSRLTEYIYRRMTETNYYSLDHLPISDWVNEVSEGTVEYNRKPSSRKNLKKQYFEAKK